MRIVYRSPLDPPQTIQKTIKWSVRLLSEVNKFILAASVAKLFIYYMMCQIREWENTQICSDQITVTKSFLSLLSSLNISCSLSKVIKKSSFLQVFFTNSICICRQIPTAFFILDARLPGWWVTWLTSYGPAAVNWRNSHRWEFVNNCRLFRFLFPPVEWIPYGILMQ